MYTDFFGLQKLPFNLTPDPSFLFLPPKHREALAGLKYAILNRKGFVVLTGDAGTGKTTLLCKVLQDFEGQGVQSSIIVNPRLTPSEFLEFVLLDFGITNVPANKTQRLWRLQEFLLQTHKEGKTAALVIDEAHELNLELLEEIRLLGNFEYGADKFLQVVLLGQCELDELLNRFEVRQFKQRIAVRLYIDALSTAEVGDYIRARWLQAGGSTIPFSLEAVEAIGQWSRGIPRLVNSICDIALITAFGEGLRTVGMDCVREAVANLALSPGPAPVARLAAVSKEPSGNLVQAGAEDRELEAEKENVTTILKDKFQDDFPLPAFATYGTPRRNVTLLKRLAGKFGLRQ